MGRVPKRATRRKRHLVFSARSVLRRARFEVMNVAKQVGAAIEFAFKWFGLLLMLAVLIAIITTKPPDVTLAASPEFVPSASAGAR